MRNNGKDIAALKSAAENLRETMSEQKFNILIKAKELLQYTIAMTAKKNMKAYRYTVCDYMIRTAMDIVKQIAYANSIRKGDEERLKLQSRAIVSCDVFNIYVETLHSVNAVSAHTMGVWGKKCTDVKYMLMAWRKRDNNS